MKAFLENVTRSLVDHPEKVDIEESTGNGGVVRFRVQVHPQDTGRLIGKNGATISAMRTLLNAAAAAQGRTVSLEILD